MAVPRPIELGIGGIEAEKGIHIVHFYHGQSQMHDVLSPYVETGIQNGEFVALVIDPALAQGVLDKLGDMGKRALDLGQLRVANGAPTPEKMGEFAKGLALECADRSCDRLRVAADMSFAASVGLSPFELLCWEAMSDGNMPEGDEVAVLCQYDVTAFPGTIILDALRTHPLCVNGGVLQENVLHMESAVFLEELEARPTAIYV